MNQEVPLGDRRQLKDLWRSGLFRPTRKCCVAILLSARKSNERNKRIWTQVQMNLKLSPVFSVTFTGSYTHRKPLFHWLKPKVQFCRFNATFKSKNLKSKKQSAQRNRTVQAIRSSVWWSLFQTDLNVFTFYLFGRSFLLDFRDQQN